jgi:hypothetical protein
MHQVHIKPERRVSPFQEPRETLQARQRKAYNAGKVAWRNDLINGQALQLYEELVRRVGANLYGWIGEETLAVELGRSTSTIKRWMRQLIAAQLIRRDRQFGHTTHTYISAYDQHDITEGNQDSTTPFVRLASDPTIRSDLLPDSFKDQNLNSTGGGEETSQKKVDDAAVTTRLQDEGVTDPDVLEELQHRSIEDIDTVLSYIARCRDRRDPRRAGLIVHLLRHPERLPARRSRMTTSSCQNKPPEVDAELGNTWKAVLERLSDEVPLESFVTWLRPTVLLHLDHDLAVIGAPNVFVRDELEKFRDTITTQLTLERAQTVNVEFVIGTE